MKENIIRSSMDEKIFTIDGYDDVVIHQYPDMECGFWVRYYEYKGYNGFYHPCKNQVTEESIKIYMDAVEDFLSKGDVYKKISEDYCRKYDPTTIDGMMWNLIGMNEL